MFEKHLFTQGTDFDSEDRAVEQGSYRYALNLQQYETGVLQNLAGTTLVTFSLPSGANKCIGSLDDLKDQKVYYFVFNSIAKHSILEFNPVTNSVTQVLQNAVLNFDLDHLITGINIIDGLLYWTDDYNPPRMINVAKAKSNLYPTPFIDQYIQAIKYPPVCPPTVGYADDLTKNINLVENKLWQVKYQYVYDNYEHSAWSPISVVPIPKIVCGTVQDPTVNNNIQVTVKTGTGIATRIRIAVREGNIKDFFLAADLVKADKQIADNTTYVYSFYNDGICSNLEVNDSNKLFDSLPLLAKAQELIEGTKITYGNGVEGFDPVQVNARLDLAFQPQPVISGFSISGKIFIRNPFASTVFGAKNQPILDLNDNNGSFFGGMGMTFTEGYNSNVFADYHQGMPLSGFVMYLAGTSYYGVSKQVAKTSTNNDAVQDSNTNAYIIDNHTRRVGVRSEMNAFNCYSTWTINNILPGRYVLRMASHLTTQDDLNNPSRPYQKTSGTAFNIAGQDDFEADIEITQTGQIYVNNVLTGSQLGDTFVMDLSWPEQAINLNFSYGLSGYVTDADIQPSPTTISGMLADTRIEKAELQLTVLGQTQTGYNSIINESGVSTLATSEWSQFRSRTDHNGFFFFAIVNPVVNTNPLQWVNTKIGLPSATTFSLFDYFSGNAFSPSNNSQVSYIVMRGSVQNQFNNFRTIIEGNILANGSPISNVSVVIGHGRVDKTDSVGTFNIVVYANSYSPGTGNSRTDRIYYSLNGSCVGTFTPNWDYFSISIVANATGQQQFVSTYGGSYNYTVTCTTTPVIAYVVGDVAVLSAGRGCSYQYGFVYYNDPNQSGTTQTNDDSANVPNPNTGIYGLRLYIPFYTEINPNTGQIYAGGRPDITINIFHQPPAWATHYQLVRTLDSVHNSKLQWTAKNIVYTDDNRNLISFTQATKIGLDIRSIIDYNTQNTDSNVTYDFTPGDRVRLIRDANGNFFNKYIDLKIRDFDPAGIIYVENPQGFTQIYTGTEFEVYTPKRKDDSEIYFEFGHCYDVLNAGTPQRCHQGVTQDQSTTFNNNVSTLPAIFTLNGHDTYYRIRRISDLSGVRARFIEDWSFSDFFVSQVQNIGRPNKVDKTFRQVRRYSTIWYSGNYIPETQINGLNSFFDTNFETYDHSWGSIQKLYSKQQRLDVFFELRVGQVLVDQTSFNDFNNQQLVGASATVLSPQIIYYSGEFGIAKNPESFATFGGASYFTDINRGVVLRLSNDGLTAISSYKNQNFFAGVSTAIKATGINPKIYGVYHRTAKEYIIAIEDIFDPRLPRNSPAVYTGLTYAFNEPANAWTSFYSYRPDFMCQNDVDLVTFKDGNIYRHNNTTRNNFYGVQYNSEIHLIINGEPSAVKFYKTISEETNSITPFVSDSITTQTNEFSPYQQLSELIAQDFERKEGVWFAPFWFDKNTSNIAAPLIEGDVLRGETMRVNLKNADTSLVKIFAVNVNWEKSERTNK